METVRQVKVDRGYTQASCNAHVTAYWSFMTGKLLSMVHMKLLWGRKGFFATLASGGEWVGE